MGRAVRAPLRGGRGGAPVRGHAPAHAGAHSLVSPGHGSAGPGGPPGARCRGRARRCPLLGVGRGGLRRDLARGGGGGGHRHRVRGLPLRARARHPGPGRASPDRVQLGPGLPGHAGLDDPRPRVLAPGSRPPAPPPGAPRGGARHRLRLGHGARGPGARLLELGRRCDSASELRRLVRHRPGSGAGLALRGAAAGSHPEPDPGVARGGTARLLRRAPLGGRR
jgi:hypothetical protein